jgi:SAM-dependent methyltransferase
MARLYGDLAAWWPLLSPPADYEEEAAFYVGLLAPVLGRERPSLLELGSGGGNNASHMKHRFDMVLVEPSEGMLAHSRALNPDCEHVQGDMRSVRLGRTFDGVFIHDAVCYMTTTGDLKRAIETAAMHCRPGGAVLVAPDHVRENFRESTDHGGHDAGPRGIRYLEWTWDPDPADTTYTVDYAYLLRTPEGTRVEHDRHIEGLFPRAVWLGLLEDSGFSARVVPLEHSEVEPDMHEVFLGLKA